MDNGERKMFMSEKCNELECGSQAKCEGCPSNQKGGFLKETHPKNRIRHVVGIVSGKGPCLEVCTMKV